MAEENKENFYESKQIGALIDENRRLAEQLKTYQADLEYLQKIVVETQAKIETVRQETQASFLSQIEELQNELEVEKKQNRLFQSQLKQSSKVPVMTAAKTSQLIDHFTGQLRNNLHGLSLKESEIKLKVAFAEVDGQEGFVIPTADNSSKIELHEISIRLADDLLSKVK